MIAHRSVTIAIVAALLAACGDEPTQPRVITSDELAKPATLTLVAISGDGQIGKAGELLPAPFVSRVVDATGAGVRGVTVRWNLTLGAGSLRVTPTGGRPYTDHSPTITDAEGFAVVRFFPAQLGPIGVTAAIDETTLLPSRTVEFGSATFTADAKAVVISNAFWGYFLGPDGADSVTVPVGTPIEWVSYIEGPVHIASTSEPAGASPIAVTLNEGERFGFMPEIAGIWEWTWHYTSPSGEVHPGELLRLTVTQP